MSDATVASPSPRTYLKQIGLMIGLLIASLLLYTFFHEGGHALMGLAFGATLTSFNVDFIGLSAHVGLDANFTPAQQALVSVSGPALPLLLAMALLLIAPRRGNAVLEWLKLLAMAVPLGSLLVWIVFPWVYLAGERPGDDSITFLLNTGFYPPLVSLGAVLVLASGVTMLLKRMDGPRGLVARMQVTWADLVSPAARRTLGVVMVLFVLVAGSAAGLGAAYGTSPLDFLNAPIGYTTAVEVQLADRALADDPVYAFTLKQAAHVELFFAVKGLTHGPVKIALNGPDGYANIFFTAEEKAAGNFTLNPRDLELAAGTYQVQVTFPQDPGVLTISRKVEPIEALSSD